MRASRSIAASSALLLCFAAFSTVHARVLRSEPEAQHVEYLNVSTEAPELAGQFVSIGSSGEVGVQLIAVPDSDEWLFMERPSFGPDDQGVWNAQLVDASNNRTTNINCRTSLENCGHTFLEDGTVAVLAGHKPQSRWPEGRKGIRLLDRENRELAEVGSLQYGHWLATVTRLPNGMVIVMSDSPTPVGPNASSPVQNPMYELWDPANPASTEVFQMDNTFLKKTKYFYYPFVFVLPTGDLFVWSNRYGQIIEPMTGRTVVVLPTWQSLAPDMLTAYPFSGSAVMLPLTPANKYTPEILICGGQWSYGWIDTPAVDLCMKLRIGITMPPAGSRTSWQTYSFGEGWRKLQMPSRRVSHSMVLLPNGHVTLINGAQAGALGDAGGGGVAMLNEPNFWPVDYDPATDNFTVLARTQIPRLLHSTAGLTTEGAILTAGGDRSARFWSTVDYSPSPTGFPEYRNEVFRPPYLFDSDNKPSITSAPSTFSYGDADIIVYTIPNASANVTSVVLVAPSSDTHTFNMHQRVIELQILGDVEDTHLDSDYYSRKIEVQGPPNANIAPAGPYLLFLVSGKTYSHGKWVSVVREVS